MRRNIIADCLLCGAANEVRDHLFSQSLYCKSVWGYILLKYGFSRPTGDWILETFTSVITRIAWNATINGIWKQRNVKVHGTADISLHASVKWIWMLVHCRLYNSKHLQEAVFES
uniref:Reverse transcriptase zinc-binding domain-containing protein n=1 Tax=Populus trichocarpa TaxID=3694 RepID=A0A2K2AP21_POPTR